MKRNHGTAVKPAAPLLALALLVLPSLAATAGEGVPPPAPLAAERQGIAVELELAPVAGADGGELREGEDVAVRFRIRDTATGSPVAGAYPAAWIDRLDERQGTGPGCTAKVEEFVGGSLLARPEIDLNVYYVLALNDDATISVVDPLFGFGGTKLLAMVKLDAPGEDWVLSADRSRLFVSLPAAGRVAVVDTATWKVVASLEVGPAPGRLALQPDGAFLWVALGGEGPAGVAAIDAEELRVAARLPTGAGRHDLALSSDGRFAFVTNQGAGTVSVIDTARRVKLRDVPVGAAPTAIAYSELAGAAYAASAATGRIAVVDPTAPEPRATIAAAPGLATIRFAPGGRLAFVANPEQDLVQIVDAAAGRLIQSGKVLAGPDQITFSGELAYVRHRGSEVVLMIPLDQVGEEGRPIPVVDFPGGQRPFGQGRRPSPADGIVRAPGARAVLVANPADGVIYYYKEGMAAPMGSFTNYERQPRAVLVVDRSLKERAPGSYETLARLGRPGRYQVAFYLDAPRAVHCFDVTVAPNPELEAQRLAERPVRVEPLDPPREAPAGEPLRLRFRLTDPATGRPAAGLADVNVLTWLASGTWQRRHAARHAGDGVYEVDVVPPSPGSYHVAVECLSQRLPFNRSPQVVLRATAPREAHSP